MNPMKFKEYNHVLKRPADMTDEQCGSLPVYRGDAYFLSCWKMTWRERLSALFFGRVWYWNYGNFHPPIYLEAKRTVFWKG